jgi:hypothetical protein
MFVMWLSLGTEGNEAHNIFARKSIVNVGEEISSRVAERTRPKS